MSFLGILASTFSDSSFVKLFTEMNAVTALLFILGIIFCFVELFLPGFGFFGIGGGVMIVVAIVLRMIYGGDALMLLYMIVILTILLGAMMIVMSKVITKGKLSKSQVFNVQPSVSAETTQGTKDYAYLLGKDGVCLTPLRPIGKALIQDALIDVTCRDGYVQKDTPVTVIAVEGQVVTVVEKTIK